MQKRNFYTLVLMSLLLAATGCKGKKQADKDATNQKEVQENTEPKSTTENKGFTDHALMFLSEEVGNYPRENGLLENEELRSRLEVLLKTEMDSLITYWNVETPVQLENNVILTSGCQQHRCPAHQYFLVVDLDLNSINVYVFKQSTLILYTEKKQIQLPGKLHVEMQTIKSNAGVTPESTRIKSLVNNEN